MEILEIGLTEKLIEYVDSHIVAMNSTAKIHISYYGNIVNNRF
jgi:hypothetical protein